MRRLARARRTAQGVLKEHALVSAPVRVDEIAKQHAHLLYEEMDADISGMLIPLPEPDRGKRWAIVVNKKHPKVRQRFTIAHELGHLLMHAFTTAHADRGYKLRFRDSRSSEGNVFEEIEANQFAAELLMPDDLVADAAAEMQIEYAPTNDRASEQALTRMASKFHVSTQALAVRLSNLLE